MATVRDFMSKNPQTVSPRSKVSEAVRTMAEKNVGSLLVVEDGKPKGIVTERDLLSKVLDVGKNPETTLVADAMSSSLAEVEPGASLKQAAKDMISKKNRLVVLEGGRLVGIVTATDIIRAIHKQGNSFDPSKTISRKVLTVSPETSVRDVVGIMNRKRVGSVIVTKDGKPYGIFTERDLIKKVLFPHLSLEKPVGDLATKQLVTAGEDIDGKEAAALIASKGIKRLLLLKGSEMVGVATARDLVEAYAAS